MEVSNVPARSSIRRLIRAAERKGISVVVTDRVMQAFDEFEQFTLMHAGDRDSLVSMVGGVVPAISEAMEEKIRATLYRHNSHVWGIRATHLIRTGITFVDPTRPDMIRAIGIVAYVGLQRLRRTAPLTIASSILSEQVAKQAGATESISGAYDGASGMRLMREFCSSPLPTLTPRDQVQGGVKTDVNFPMVAKADAISLYLSRLVPEHSAQPQPPHGINSIVHTPTEHMVCELLVPHGWVDSGKARVKIYGHRQSPDSVRECRPEDVLPQQESVVYMGASTCVPELPGVPRHAEAVRSAMDELGLHAMFDVFRCIVKYPVLHTLVDLRVDEVD
ncbi:MAG: hypothetical protein AB7Q00_10455 [Phycisphaerales bacterium]|nr:MAG: hypothetical protein IPK69_00285 [Phycisphaerales bacterium]